jgi:hypothetical protein
MKIIMPNFDEKIGGNLKYLGRQRHKREDILEQDLKRNKETKF